MGLVVIVDAYNVLKKKHTKFIGQREREYFLELLNNYAQRKEHDITAVFDGGESDRAYREQYKNIKVIYSGIQQSADDVILGIIPKLIPKKSLVVSSDHLITNKSNKYEIAHVDAHIFYSHIVPRNTSTDQALKIHKTELIKTTKQTSQTLDALMRDGTKKMFDKDSVYATQENTQNVTTPKQKKLSKIEKFLAHIASKL